MNIIPSANPAIRIKAFSKQVGGHTQIFFNTAHDATSELWKPLEKREKEFYESAQGNPTLCSLIPEYFGSYTLQASQITLRDKTNSEGSDDEEIPAFSIQTTNDLSVALSRLPKVPPNSDDVTSEPRYPFLVIRDVTTFCVHPCVFDIKLGVRQYADDATPEKVRSHTLKAQRSTSAKLGCRACGCCTWDCVRKQRIYISKYAGQSGTEFPAFMAIVRSFFENGTDTPRRDVARRLAEGVQRILDVVEDRERFPFRVYSASLIVVYDGAVLEKPCTEVKLIDFATVYKLKSEDEVIDDGITMGLRNVIKAFNEI